MRTAREILLSRHQAANPKLDQIRRAAVSGLDRQEAKRQSSSGFGSGLCLGWQSVWRELILPRPQAWAAVATMWVVIIALKLSTNETPHVAARRISASPEVLAEVKQQQRLFAELAGLVDPRVALPAKSTLPRPRSDQRLRVPVG